MKIGGAVTPSVISGSFLATLTDGNSTTIATAQINFALQSFTNVNDALTGTGRQVTLSCAAGLQGNSTDGTLSISGFPAILEFDQAGQGVNTPCLIINANLISLGFFARNFHANATLSSAQLSGINSCVVPSRNSFGTASAGGLPSNWQLTYQLSG